ncbi:hypothetical protein [Flaviaesturariibacter amylovorans]|uniref:hypothetical protein n=1 Tax=Flaviaesturariibacter amylovorans TaxID=1084520 RepID=UPI0031E85903
MKNNRSLSQERPEHYRFQHKQNGNFTGYLLNESQDFYTIQLTCAVAGLNAIWRDGEVVRWSREWTSIIKKVNRPK